MTERHGRSGAELADELAAATKVTRDMLAGFDDNLWAMPAPGGFDLWGPALLAFDGLPEFAVGDASGRRLTGDAYPFVLVATGRADPASLGLDASVNIYR